MGIPTCRRFKTNCLFLKNLIAYTTFATLPGILEKMRKLPCEHPKNYNEFQKGEFVVKTSNGFFKRISPDMKLEKTIQCSQIASSCIDSQTKKISCASEWELFYYKILAKVISMKN